MTEPNELASTMSFRERVATAALQGLLANNMPPRQDLRHEEYVKRTGQVSVQYADALIAALNAK